MTRDGGDRSRSCRPSGCATSSSSCCWRRTRGPVWSCSCASGLAEPRAARAAGPAARGRRAPPPQGRLRALADRARAGHRPRGTARRARRSRCPGPTSCCASPRCCTTSASPRPAGSRTAAGSPSTTTRWSAPSSPPSGCEALRFDKETTKAVARLVELHLRFHGYGEGQWTDSAVRRYVTDAGPLLPRLHRLTRADCTTRNVRKARRLAATYDDLEARIERAAGAGGAARRCAPSSTATRSPRRSASGPGRCSGGPTSTCLAVRLDEGPLGKDAARERLLAWWAEQPESQA